MKSVSIVLSGIALGAIMLAISLQGAPQNRYEAVGLDPANSISGYLARLLINEVPFPGERGWQSERDTSAAMVEILWVLESRRVNIPPGYKQEEVAAVQSDKIIDLITAGGRNGQCKGFYRDTSGQFVAEQRVFDRIDRLITLANEGEPGQFARLLATARNLARTYTVSGIKGVDRYAALHKIGRVRVTGHAYSWMTDQDYYHPGGRFVRIPDADEGSLGGNRFYTLQRVGP